ncbi:MAG: hypothetical protein ACYCOR_17850 [Acidobacteriaceae bacterium]
MPYYGSLAGGLSQGFLAGMKLGMDYQTHKQQMAMIHQAQQGNAIAGNFLSRGVQPQHLVPPPSSGPILNPQLPAQSGPQGQPTPAPGQASVPLYRPMPTGTHMAAGVPQIAPKMPQKAPVATQGPSEALQGQIINQDTQGGPAPNSMSLQDLGAFLHAKGIHGADAYSAAQSMMPFLTQEAKQQLMAFNQKLGIARLQQSGDLGAARLKETQAIQHNTEWYRKQSLALKKAALAQNTTGGNLGVPDSTDHGQAFLSQFPKSTQDLVNGLYKGTVPFPSSFALKTPYWERLIKILEQTYPHFDAANYPSRQATRKDFTSGKAAQTVNALNTVLGHLGKLSDAAEKLHNRSLPAWNSVANSSESALGNPQLKDYNITKEAVIREVNRVYRQAGGSEADIQSWDRQLTSSNSPAQFKGVMAQIAKLLESKIQALGIQYNQGMGTTAQPLSLLSPKARRVLVDLLHQGAAPGSLGTTIPGQGVPTQAPPQAPTEPNLQALLNKYAPQ